MHPPAISLEQPASLPEIYRTMIPAAYEDRNGHMNVRCYLVLYDKAGDAMYPMLGLTDAYFAASGMGGFDLEITSGTSPKCASETRWRSGYGCLSEARSFAII